jgi:hypothetical protein
MKMRVLNSLLSMEIPPKSEKCQNPEIPMVFEIDIGVF